MKSLHRGSTLFLRTALTAIVLGTFGICIFALPSGISSEEAGDFRILFWGMYATAVPFLLALYQAWRLLDYIDDNSAFSEQSVTALRRIKYCAMGIGVWYTAMLPLVYKLAQAEDAPGLMVLGLVVAGASWVIATFAGILQKLLYRAIALKSENDLTV